MAQLSSACLHYSSIIIYHLWTTPGKWHLMHNSDLCFSPHMVANCHKNTFGKRFIRFALLAAKLEPFEVSLKILLLLWGNILEIRVNFWLTLKSSSSAANEPIIMKISVKAHLLVDNHMPKVLIHSVHVQAHNVNVLVHLY